MAYVIGLDFGTNSVRTLLVAVTIFFAGGGCAIQEQEKVLQAQTSNRKKAGVNEEEGPDRR